MSVVAPPPAEPRRPDDLDALIREARSRQRRRRIQIAAGVLTIAGLGLAGWAAVPSRAGSVVHRYRGPVDATVTGEIAAAGTHSPISYVGTGGGVTWAAKSRYKGPLWLTSDGGRSWHTLRLPAHAWAFKPGTPKTVGNIQFVDKRHGWVTLGYRVYRTGDGGRTWQVAVSGPRCLARRCDGIETLSFLDRLHGFAFVGVLSNEPHELFRTDDGGRTWHLVSRSETLGQVAMNGRDGFMAVQGPGVLGPYHGPGVGALFRTTDGGRTWSPDNIAGSRSWIELPLGVFGRRVLAVQNGPNPGDAINVYAGTVWSTADNGGHWDGSAVPQQVRLPQSFSLASPNFWAFAAESSNDLYVTSSAGHSWRRIVLGGPPLGRDAIEEISFSTPRLGWAILAGRFLGVRGQSALIRTTDGGVHWTVAGPPAGKPTPVKPCNPAQLGISLWSSYNLLPHAQAHLAFSNTGRLRCRLSGWPTVVAVEGDGITVRATRISPARARLTRPIVLGSGGSTWANLDGGTDMRLGTGLASCPRAVSLRVTPPGGRRATTITGPWRAGGSRGFYFPVCGGLSVTPVLRH